MPTTSSICVVAERSPLTWKPFDGFAVRKSANTVYVHDFEGFETRNLSTFRLLLAAIDMLCVEDFPWILVNTGDRDAPTSIKGIPSLSYSTTCGTHDHVCPDFVFDHWRQTQLDDYDLGAKELTTLGMTRPVTDQLGWRGALTHPVRQVLAGLDDKRDFDTELIVWDRSNPGRLTCSNFVSLADQVRRWRYLIDIEGTGYSGRLKLLFFSRRVVFLQQRPFEEWYFPDLKPWMHYVPVRRDLADLIEQLHRLKQQPDLEQMITDRALEFASLRLTRGAAIARWGELLSSHARGTLT